MKLFYKNDLSSLKQLASDIESYTAQNNIPPATAYALNLCLDEVLTNIISYNLRNNNTDLPIEMELYIANNEIIAITRDSGIAFNPLENFAHNTPNTHSPVEERHIGGLGIYFLEQYMDRVEYKRENNQNILTLFKNINNHS